MCALQLAALAIFPYATLMMAGMTLVSVIAQTVIGSGSGAWRVPMAYGLACAVVDVAFLRHGKVSVSDHSTAIHWQPGLPHLIGGTWILLIILTVATGLNKTLGRDVKWTLVVDAGGRRSN